MKKLYFLFLLLNLDLSSFGNKNDFLKNFTTATDFKIFEKNPIKLNSVRSNKVNFIVSTLPKAGSHLIIKCLQMITNKKPRFIAGLDLKNTTKFLNLADQFPWGHLSYSNESLTFLDKYSYKKFFIYRDPRDWLVSAIYWNFRQGNEGLFPKDLISKDFSEKIHYALLHLNSSKVYIEYIKWLNDSECCSVKFEDLIGPKGEGTIKNQLCAIKTISKHINHNLSDAEIIDIADNLFGNTATFRNGQIGSWKSHFIQQDIDLVKTLFGELLIELGYEKDLNWGLESIQAIQ